MFEINPKLEKSVLESYNSELIVVDYTVLNRLQFLAFELQSIFYNYNKNCLNPDSKKAIYLETYINYIGEIFNQTILSHQISKKDIEKELII